MGELVAPSDPRYMVGRGGMLMFEPDRHLEMRATLLDIETGNEVFYLSRARLIKAGHGGMLFGGIKSKGEAWRQSWWCVPMTKVVLPVQEEAPPAVPSGRAGRAGSGG